MNVWRFVKVGIYYRTFLLHVKPLLPGRVKFEKWTVAQKMFLPSIGCHFYAQVKMGANDEDK